jgi:hypothetical protein
MRMNGLSKSSPKPHRSKAFFYSLFLQRVQYIFNIEAGYETSSGPKPRRSETFFYSLLLLCVQYVFNMETESVTRRLNPSRFSSINTCGRHANKNSSHQPANAYRFSPPSLLHHQNYFIPIADVHLQPGEQVFETVVLSDPTLRDGE